MLGIVSATYAGVNVTGSSPPGPPCRASSSRSRRLQPTSSTPLGRV